MVMSWSANLFAQAIYMGFNGVPFDGIAMVNSLGNWYYAVLHLKSPFGYMLQCFWKTPPCQDEPSDADSNQPLKSIHCIKSFR